MQSEPLIWTHNTMEPNMQDILWAFWMTIELWLFLGLLAAYLLIEPLLVDKQSR